MSEPIGENYNFKYVVDETREYFTFKLKKSKGYTIANFVLYLIEIGFLIYSSIQLAEKFNRKSEYHIFEVESSTGTTFKTISTKENLNCGHYGQLDSVKDFANSTGDINYALYYFYFCLYGLQILSDAYSRLKDLLKKEKSDEDSLSVQDYEMHQQNENQSQPGELEILTNIIVFGFCPVGKFY